MAVDRDLDGRDRARHHVAQFRAGAPVDRAGRQVEQEIGHARAVVAAGQAAQQLVELGTDPRKGGHRGEERVEQARPQGGLVD